MPFLKTEDPGMEVFPMVNNFDGANWVGGIVRFSEQSRGAGAFRRTGGGSFFRLADIAD